IEGEFVRLMRKDELFDDIYKKIIYGGSYYKGTRYGKPEEFDLDFIIKLPLDYAGVEIDTNHQDYGFVKIQVNRRSQHPIWKKHEKILSKWITSGGYLDQNKFRQWMESVFTKTISQLSGSAYYGYEVQFNGRRYSLKHRKSGPAFTLILTTPDGSIIDVDLVPALEFDDTPLGNGYRHFTGYRRNWLVVAKPFKDAVQSNNILWRLCFYEQEKEFLEGDVKPVIRMMKMFRDTQGFHQICSYFIETIFYHMIENEHEFKLEFVRAPKTSLFIKALRNLENALKNAWLPYFWHPQYNLLGKINRATLKNWAGRMNQIISTLEKGIDNDPYILADIVVGRAEGQKLRKLERQGAILEESMADLHISPSQESPSWCTLS
ncbi:hypothetical protein QAD02_006829, partial [Eretmocerus hayati]